MGPNVYAYLKQEPLESLLFYVHPLYAVISFQDMILRHHYHFLCIGITNLF